MRNYEGYGRSGGRKDFSPTGLASAGATTNASSAADAVSVGSIYGSLRDSAPKMDEIAATAAKNRAQERIDTMNAKSNMAQAGISAAANIKAAEEEAEASGEDEEVANDEESEGGEEAANDEESEKDAVEAEESDEEADGNEEESDDEDVENDEDDSDDDEDE